MNIYEEKYSSVGTCVDKHMLSGFCTWAPISVLSSHLAEPKIHKHVAPLSPITENASIKVKDCCTKNLFVTIISAEENHNKSVLPG